MSEGGWQPVFCFRAFGPSRFPSPASRQSRRIQPGGSHGTWILLRVGAAAVVTMTQGVLDTDVFIVGGGPAGLAAALAARRRGFSMTVADQSIPPIDKACGEGLMPDSHGVFAEIGISLEAVETGVFKGITFICGNREASAIFPCGGGY